MRAQKPVASMGKGDEKILALVMLRDRKPTLELNPQNSLAVDVLGYEVRALPIIAKTHRHKAVIRENARNLAEVVVFLLFGLEVAVTDFHEVEFVHSYSLSYLTAHEAYTELMARKHQGPEDFAEGAFRIFQEAIGETPASEPEKPKNEAAVALGRLGGLKGGKARAAKLTPEQRSEIARNAVRKRWAKNSE